jgi:methylmalonyl-CoA/ethylmalonyl-CoA epimerase
VGSKRTGLAGLHYPITQISLAVSDLSATMARYHEAFGWAPWQVFDHVQPVHHSTELRGELVDYALRGAEVYVGSMNFELLEPIEGPNLWSEFIDRRGEGIASIATMFHERADGDAVKIAFWKRFGIPVNMRAEIGDHIEYYYLDTEGLFGCLIESGSGHAIDFVRPAQVYPADGAQPGPSPATGLICPLTQVTIVVRDLDARLPVWHEAFGWAPWRVFDSATMPRLLGDFRVRGATVEHFRVRWAQVKVGDMNLELVEPRGGSTPWQEFLDATGEGIFSIAVTFPSRAALGRMTDYFAALGIGVIASAAIGSSAEWVLFDTGSTFKCLIASGTGHTIDIVEGGGHYS